MKVVIEFEAEFHPTVERDLAREMLLFVNLDLDATIGRLFGSSSSGEVKREGGGIKIRVRREE